MIFYKALTLGSALALAAVHGAQAGGKTPTGDPQARADSAAVQEAEPAVAPPVAPPLPKGRARPGAKPGASNSTAKAMDRIDLERTQITGNRELPKVMVVVPWKRSDIGDLVGRPVNSLVDEVLQPVDREVFRRELDYYGALSPDRPRDETHVTSGPPKERPEK